MKLRYDLPPAEKEVYTAALGEGEETVFCLPYDIAKDGEAEGGYVAVTPRCIRRLSGGEIRDTYPILGLSDFAVETLYGACSFVAVRDGVAFEICRFTPGIHQPRFATITYYCEKLAAGKPMPELNNKEPERVCPKCGMPYVPHTETCRFCTRDKNRYKSILDATKGLRLILLFPLVVMAFSLAIRFVVPGLQKTAINQYIYPPAGVERGPAEQFAAIVVALILFDLVSRVLSVVQSRLSGVSGNRFSVRLRRVMFDKVEQLSLSSIQRHSIGYLSERISSDVSVIGSFLTNQLPQVFSQVLALVVGTVLILSISPTMSLLVILPVPFAFLYTLFTRKFLRRYSFLERYESVRYARTQYDIVCGSRVIKCFGKEEDMIEKHGNRLQIQLQKALTNSALSSALGLLTLLIYEIGSYLLLWFGNLWLFNGEIDVGTINQFTAYSAIFYEPLRQFTTLPAEIIAFRTALSQMSEILDEEIEVRDAPEPVCPDILGHIEVDRVTFGYNAYEPVLRKVSLEINPGEMVGIVGHSGCGKTTLVSLIMRLYDVNRGSIMLDGVDLRNIPQKYLRSNIGVVPQETQLFDGTIRQNIKYSKPDATDEQVILAAKVANAHDFIMSLPEGYNTRVGDRGYALSGGERQRIAIARALIHDPKILILDEATAALDTETEKSIQEALDRLTVGRTTIAIAHRLSTLRNADRIIVFDHGRVIEAGTHKELLDQRGKYYSLVMAQAEAALGNDVLLEKTAAR